MCCADFVGWALVPAWAWWLLAGSVYASWFWPSALFLVGGYLCDGDREKREICIFCAISMAVLSVLTMNNGGIDLGNGVRVGWGAF